MMKKEASKTVQKEKNLWIDVHDDNVMREMGFNRPFNQIPRDKNVWEKTPSEHRAVKKAKHSTKKRDMHFYSIPPKRPTVYAKLIIQLKPNKTFYKTTYSQMCFDTQIPDILGKFQVVNSKTGYAKSYIAKYSYNGITYVQNS